MSRTSTLYSTAFVAVLSAYMAACGGGGDPLDEATPTEAVMYEPAPDALIQVPDGYASDAAFMVSIRGNWREVGR